MIFVTLSARYRFERRHESVSIKGYRIAEMAIIDSRPHTTKYRYHALFAARVEAILEIPDFINRPEQKTSQ
ncbi:hypothetical protein [Shewanella algidipiscicola]|uniref:hypothetical protein n=1 Tax=Shewanella algidipiscicola TaxID=614070 RepID=UPI000D789BCD|nr:hypothetical protein [Shewanella algidipiscicola]